MVICLISARKSKFFKAFHLNLKTSYFIISLTETPPKKHHNPIKRKRNEKRKDFGSRNSRRTKKETAIRKKKVTDFYVQEVKKSSRKYTIPTTEVITQVERNIRTLIKIIKT